MLFHFILHCRVHPRQDSGLPVILLLLITSYSVVVYSIPNYVELSAPSGIHTRMTEESYTSCRDLNLNAVVQNRFHRPCLESIHHKLSSSTNKFMSESLRIFEGQLSQTETTLAFKLWPPIFYYPATHT